MKKARNLTLPAPGYLLSEENRTKLQMLRNHCLLMADMAYVSTLEEERVLLMIPRTVLAQCFESAADRIGEVLETTMPCHEAERDTSRRH